MLEIVSILIVTILILMLGFAATLCYMVKRIPAGTFLIILSVLLIRQGAGFLAKQTGQVPEESVAWQLLGAAPGFIVFCFLLMLVGGWTLWDFFSNLGGVGPELEHTVRQRHNHSKRNQPNRKKSREL